MTAARLSELFVMLRSFQSSNRLERVAILGRRPDSRSGISHVQQVLE